MNALTFKENNMKLSDQALGAVMLALQKSLMEQTDIVPVLRSFDLIVEDGTEELVVTNPPTVKFDVDQRDSQDA
jgi:hypothetical protein